MSDFQRDLEASSSDFLRVVWPAIGPLVGGGEIVPVESVADKGMATMLDQRSGIDAWHLSRGKQVRGIASRVQWVRTAPRAPDGIGGGDRETADDGAARAQRD